MEAFWLSPSPPGDLPWVMRQEGMLLTGILALGAMTAVMILALRPRWLESPLGGMDKAYLLHKWLGIIAIALSVAHWLTKQSKPLIVTAIGNAGRPAKVPAPDWVGILKPYAKTLGEWTFYALILMLVITLARRAVPYKRWYWLHRFMPLAYLLLVFHGIVLTPPAYWEGLGGWLLALTMMLGIAAAVRQLLRDLRPRYPHAGTVVSLAQRGDVLEVQCRMGDSWPGHDAGQFVFLRLPGEQEAHPFTLSDADKQNHLVRFHIKQRGDWTGSLRERLAPGIAVELDGPYGRFVPPDHDDGAVHVWVGAGVARPPSCPGWASFTRTAMLPRPGCNMPVSMRSTPWLRRCKRLPRVIPTCIWTSSPTAVAGHPQRCSSDIRPTNHCKCGSVAPRPWANNWNKRSSNHCRRLPGNCTGNTSRFVKPILARAEGHALREANQGNTRFSVFGRIS